MSVGFWFERTDDIDDLPGLKGWRGEAVDAGKAG